jgi:hydrogenase maturation factor
VSCDEHHCVTCADEAVPMRVVEVSAEGVARCVDAEGKATDVMVELVAPLHEGAWVLVHAGTALQLAEPPEAVLGRRLDGARQGAEVPALPVPERRQ